MKKENSHEKIMMIVAVSILTLIVFAFSASAAVTGGYGTNAPIGQRTRAKTQARVCETCSGVESRTSSGFMTGTINWFIDFNTEILYLLGSGGIINSAANSHSDI